MGRGKQLQNCAGPIFTYHERKKLQKKWGTAKVRLGSDGQHPHGACALCLHHAVEPLSCPEGHVYCKSCIYENLLAQKQQKKAQQGEFDAQEQRQKNEELAKQKEEEQRKVDRFVTQETGILPSKKTMFGVALAVTDVKYIPEGYEETKTPDGIIYTKKMSEEDKRKSKELPCYWIPQLTPDAVKVVNKPTKHTMCPASNHPLRLKHLRPVLFSEAEADSSKKALDSSRFKCPSCHKTVNKVMKLFLIRKCGHVLCKYCTDTFTYKDKACVVCGKACTEKEVVALQSGGSGFSSHGSKTVEAQNTPAFQSF